MSQIRKCFKSRFPRGVLLELDFSQLEIFVLAYLSGDKQLRSDLLSGEDLHGISATMLYGKSYTPKQRKIAKQLSFQLQYGAGAASLAKSNGIPLADAKRFIENYYKRYPGVKAWQDSIAEEVRAGRVVSEDRTKKGYPAGKSTLKSETGRRYTFTEKDAPDFLAEKGIMVSFSPTQMKNYPVQGYATADIVPMILGKLYRYLAGWCVEEQVLLVGTIHDSVVFDCESHDVAIRWARYAKEIMENAPNFLKDIFNIDFDLPLKVGVDVGENWYDMKAVDL